MRLFLHTMLIFCLCLSFPFSTEAQDLAKDIVRINRAQSELDNCQTTVLYGAQKLTDRNTNAIKTMKLLKSGQKSYQIFDDKLIQVVNGDRMVMVNKQSKEISLRKTGFVMNWNQWSKSLEGVIGANTSSVVFYSDNDSIKRYEISSKVGNYDKITIRFNAKTFLFVSIQLSSTALLVKQSFDFSYQALPVNMSGLFDFNSYFSLSDGVYKPAAAYADYRFTNLLNTK